jgi:hypothetical protein
MFVLTPRWAQHLAFLLRPGVYLRIHMLADILGIVEIALKRQQSADPLTNGASDVCMQVETLKAELRGYGSSAI